MELSQGNYIPIGEFMQLHTNKNVYYKHVKTAYIKKRDESSSKNKGLNRSTKKIIAATGTKSTRLNRASMNNPNHVPYELPQPNRTKNNNLVSIDEFKETVVSDSDYSSSSRNRSSMSMKVTMIGSVNATTINEDDQHSEVPSTYQTNASSSSNSSSSGSTGRLINGARSWGNPHTYNKNANGSGFTRARNNTIISGSKSGSQSAKVRRGTVI